MKTWAPDQRCTSTPASDSEHTLPEPLAKRAPQARVSNCGASRTASGGIHGFFRPESAATRGIFFLSRTAWFRLRSEYALVYTHEHRLHKFM